MLVQNKNNKFVSYLIILLSLFILILFTKTEVVNLQSNLDQIEIKENNLEAKKAKLTELNELKKELSSSNEIASKYNIEFKEEDIIDYIYSYIEENQKKNWLALVRSISISEPMDTEIWFKEVNINLTLNIANENKLKDILDFLTSNESKYRFFIPSFNFPYWNTEEAFTVSIPLKLLYK